MEVKDTRRCLACGQTFKGIHAQSRLWRHQQCCRVLQTRRVGSVSTAPAALGAAIVSSTSGTGVSPAVLSASNAGFIPDALGMIVSPVETLLGFDGSLLFGIPDPVLDEVLGPTMTGSEAAHIVRQGRALSGTMSKDQFVSRMAEELPHWPTELLQGVFEGCLPAALPVARPPSCDPEPIRFDDHDGSDRFAWN